jgi:hypothetical protein
MYFSLPLFDCFSLLLLLMDPPCVSFKVKSDSLVMRLEPLDEILNGQSIQVDLGG